MHKYIILCIFLLFLLCVTHGSSGSPYRKNRKRNTSNEFDVLIFTQSWPPTACFIWKESSESHSCSLPKRNQWTIHGIWPTQYHSYGPEYCDKSLSFNASALVPIESQLKENWIDVHNGSKHYSFWKHEWDKHGTCAVTIDALNNELKYFQMGLKLLNAYNMIDVLKKESISPSQEKYTVQNVLQAIEKNLGKRAIILCTKNEKTDESYIREIRLCFDKTLQLVDCDGIPNFPTNCDKSEMIVYPGHVPSGYQFKYYDVIQV